MTKNKNTNIKKLIPAFSMLAISAVMLSASTYAWFTMNKEVEVNGLNMQATASEGLEISLGALGTNTASPTLSGSSGSYTISAPAANDISWKRQITIDDYYKEVGRLSPASTDNPLTLYSVPTANVFGGGHYVEDNATVSAVIKMATFTPEYNAGGTLTVLNDDTLEGKNGYYIDVPMWIRAANHTANDGTPIYCGVTITDGATPSGEGATAEDLMKAVRVAIIPMGKNADDTTLTITDNSTLSPESSASFNPASTIYALKATGNQIDGTSSDYPTYRGKTLGDNTANTTYSANLVTQPTYVEANDEQTNGLANHTILNSTAVFTIPKANDNCFGQVGFIARIWIEGESIYCEDATASQDWNIDFFFTTDNAPTNAGG